jgi:DNA integrity scanning protein DisA with diadenylate cyclase activity
VTLVFAATSSAKAEIFSVGFFSHRRPSRARRHASSAVLTLTTQLAVEGREGHPVGALFVLGDSDRVVAQSRQLVLNPFHAFLPAKGSTRRSCW